MATVTVRSIRQSIGDTGIETGSVDLGSMAVLGHRWPKGFDAEDLLRAACGETLCPVPHYFIPTSGAFQIRYTDDGSVETVRTGDVAYARPGHTVMALEDCEVIEITPADGNAFLAARIAASGVLG